jgi:ABC-2 type transport system permease protein
MRTFFTLLKREYWEHKYSFFWIPAITGIILILLTVILINTINWTFPPGISGSTEEARKLTLMLMQAIRIPFIPLCLFSILAYALSTLYEERKDKSILFWRSMPISDVATVASKICTALFTLPVFYFIIIAVVQAVISGILQLAIVYHHIPATISPLGISQSWLLLAGSLLMQSLLLFPIIAWAMLASLVAKRTPFLYATVPLILISLIEVILFQHSYFFTTLREYGANILNVPYNVKELNYIAEFPKGALTVGPSNSLAGTLQHAPILVYFAIGCALSAVIIALRKRAQ